VRASCTQSRGWTVTGVCTCVSRSCGANPTWGSWGGNLFNTRNAADEKGISPANAARLGQAWVFNTTNDVSATPTVVGNRLLVPDWGGYMYCLNADTGERVSHVICYVMLCYVASRLMVRVIGC
jgi:polyvinyl alcohol dehydrogenase (cytochrome)